MTDTDTPIGREDGGVGSDQPVNPVVAALQAGAERNAHRAERLLFGIEPPGPDAEGERAKPWTNGEDTDDEHD